MSVVDRVRSQSFQFQSKAMFASDVEVRKERIVLKTMLTLRLFGADARSARLRDRSPRRGLLETAEHPERRRLAANRRGEQRHECPALRRGPAHRPQAIRP